MNSAKRSSHKKLVHNSTKPSAKNYVRTLNQDYYINCHKTNLKVSCPTQRSQTAKQAQSKTKLRSITQATEPRINSQRSIHKQKSKENCQKGIERTRSRTLLKSRHTKRMSEAPKQSELEIIYERVATTLTNYKEKISVLNQENRKLWEENRRLRINSLRR